MQAGELHILSTDFTIKSKSRIICIPDGWMLAAGAKVRFAAPDAPPVNDDHGGTARIFIADGREWWGQTEIHPDHEWSSRLRLQWPCSLWMGNVKVADSENSVPVLPDALMDLMERRQVQKEPSVEMEAPAAAEAWYAT
eukprot:s627_g50.t1